MFALSRSRPETVQLGTGCLVIGDSPSLRFVISIRIEVIKVEGNPRAEDGSSYVDICDGKLRSHSTGGNCRTTCAYNMI
jgi:hypothetical protein